MAKDRAASRLSQLARFSTSPRGAHGVQGIAYHLVSLVTTTVLRASYLASDHHRNALMLAVFGFKVGEERLGKMYLQFESHDGWSGIGATIEISIRLSQTIQYPCCINIVHEPYHGIVILRSFRACS